jgi:COMPASS component SWD3
MSEHPRSDDAVQGQSIAPEASAVLGGIARLKQQLAAEQTQLQLVALESLLKYGDEGLDIVIEALNNSSDLIRAHAYNLLTKNSSSKVQSILKLVSPYALFQCVRVLERSDGHFCLIPASEFTIEQYPQGRIASIKKFAIQVWDLDSTEVIYLLKGHTNYVIDLAITPDGKHLISSSRDKTIRIWDLASGEIVRVLSGHTHLVSSIVISPDGQYLFSGSRDKTIKVWSLQTGKELKTLSGRSSWIYHLALSPDGKTIASSTQRDTIKIWDWQTGKLLHTLSGGSSGFIKALIHPDGKTAYSYYGTSNQIRVWNLKTGKLISVIQAYPDVDPKTMQLESGEEISLSRSPISVMALASTPDGQALVISGSDGSLKFLDVLTSKEIVCYQVPQEKFVEQILFTQDGQKMYTLWTDHFTHNPVNSFQIWHSCQVPH